MRASPEIGGRSTFFGFVAGLGREHGSIFRKSDSGRAVDKEPRVLEV
jgi:hypothetical protein